MKRYYNNRYTKYFLLKYTKELIIRKFQQWKNKLKFFYYIQKYLEYQGIKPYRYLVYNKLLLLLIILTSYKLIIIDFIIDLSLNKQTYYYFKSILVVVDDYTKVIRYLLVFKLINIIEHTKIIYNKVISNYKQLNSIINN